MKEKSLRLAYFTSFPVFRFTHNKIPSKMFYLIAETTICICQTTFQPDRTSVYCCKSPQAIYLYTGGFFFPFFSVRPSVRPLYSSLRLFYTGFFFVRPLYSSLRLYYTGLFFSSVRSILHFVIFFFSILDFFLFSILLFTSVQGDFFFASVALFFTSSSFFYRLFFPQDPFLQGTFFSAILLFTSF